MTRTQNAGVVCLLLTLSACGGGGGGGGSSSSVTAPTIAITSTNAERVAAAALVGANTDKALGGSNSLLTSNSAGAASAQTAPATIQSAVHAARPMASAGFNDACDLASGGSVGNVSGTVNDADNSRSLSVGDSVNATFNNCYLNVDGATFTGKFTMRVTSLSGTPFSSGGSIGLDMGFTNFATDGLGADDFSVNGSTHMDFAETSGTSVLRIVGGSMTLGVGTDSVTVRNPDLTFSESAGAESIFGHATLTSSALAGTIAFDIPAASPFVANTGGDPTSGSMSITGKDSRLQLTVLAADSVRLQVDENNDGVFDADKTVTWSAIAL